MILTAAFLAASIGSAAAGHDHGSMLPRVSAPIAVPRMAQAGGGRVSSVGDADLRIETVEIRNGIERGRQRTLIFGAARGVSPVILPVVGGGR